jgi:hypothetical protein
MENRKYLASARNGTPTVQLVVLGKKGYFKLGFATSHFEA